jgi:hypothetical protein
MCPCGGEMTDWCFDCGDYACDDCGCPNSLDHLADDDDRFHDLLHPVWREGCDDCIDRANRLELTRPSPAGTDTTRDDEK